MMRKSGNHYPIHRRPTVPKTTGKNIKQPIVTCRIVPGKSTEHQKRLWRAAWERLIATVQNELKAENEAKGEH